SVLSDGSVVRLGGKAIEDEGYDLVGTFVGSEGTLGIVTEITVKLTPLPEEKRTLMAAFATMDAASETVSSIIAAGIVPSAIEMMDQLATEAVEAAVHAGYPLDAGGILLVEVDGARDGLDEQLARLERAKEAGLEILTACIEAGGSLTGEHGVGMEKNCYMPLQFTSADLAAMRRVKDAFDPAGLANPGKIFPTPSRCREFALGARS